MPKKSTDGVIPEGLSLNRILPTRAGEQLLLGWSSDGQWLVAVFGDSSLELWHTQTGILQREYKAPLSTVTCIAWSPNAKILALAGSGGVVTWNRETSEAYHSFNQGNGLLLNSVSWSPNGRMLACGASDKTIWILDAETRQVGQPFIGHSKAICSVAWSPKGNVLASSAEDGSIRLWNIIKKTGEQGRQSPLVCPGHIDAVCALTWTADGEVLASASLDQTIRLWDKAGQQKGILEGLAGEVRSIAFLKDAVSGQLLAAKVSDGTILLWRIDLREARVTFPEPYTTGRYAGLAFHPQLPLLVTPGENETNLCIWNVDLHRLFENASMGQSVLYRNAKVVIVGNSGTGKSNLNQALAEDQAVIAEVSPQEHHIRLLEKQEKRSEEDGHWEVYETFLWDMDGRPGYRLIHQMYLHDVVIALIVLDAVDEIKSIADVPDWVHAVERIRSQHSPAIKMFLVITRADRSGRGFPLEQLQRLKKDHGFEGIFVTSASQGWGIRELKKAILEAIDWEMLPEVSSTTFIQEIRNFLNDKREAGQRLCDENELYEAFQHIWTRTVKSQDGDPHAQFEACIGRVEAQGLIRRLSFDSSVLLHPELFDAYASALLDEAKNDPDHFGSLDEDKALQGNFLVAESVRIKDKRLERILLNSIVRDFLRYDIAFRERNDGPEQRWSLIFPSQSTQDNPDLPDPEQKHYIFRFEGEVTRLYSTLAVRLARSKSFVRKELWRNAITYKSESGEMCGIFLQMHSETDGELTVFLDAGAATTPQTQFDFTSYVYWHLKSRGKITRIQRIFRCYGCGISFTEQQIKRRRERQESTITCPNCEKVMPLPDNEELFTFSAGARKIDRNADEQLRADTVAEEVKRRKEEGDYDILFCYNDNEEDEREIGVISNELEKRGFVTWFEGRDMQPGKLKFNEIAEQIHKIKAAAICFGNKNDNPRWKDLQMESLLNQFIERGCRIILVLLKHAPREKPNPPFLGGKWIDFHNWKPHPIDELIWGITGKRP